MGKIGNSLSATISWILLGKVKEDEIEKIYAGTGIKENELEIWLDGNNPWWEADAFDYREKLSEENIELNEEQFEELKENLKTRAREILYRLWNSGKIIQSKYHISEGEEVEIKSIDPNEKENSTPVEYRTKDGWVITINGEYFNYESDIYVLEKSRCGLFDSELELIADQIRFLTDDIYVDRKYFLQRLFPQYSDVIEEVWNIPNLDWKTKEEVLAIFQEKLRSQTTSKSQAIEASSGER